jgi:hypothetical protein
VEVERDFKAFYSLEKSTYLAAWLSSIWEPIAASLYNRHAAYIFSVGTQEGWRNLESNNNSLTIFFDGWGVSCSKEICCLFVSERHSKGLRTLYCCGNSHDWLASFSNALETALNCALIIHWYNSVEV